MGACAANDLHSPCCCEKETKISQMDQKLSEASVDEWLRGTEAPAMSVPAAMLQPTVRSRQALSQGDGAFQERTDRYDNGGYEPVPPPADDDGGTGATAMVRAPEETNEPQSPAVASAQPAPEECPERPELNLSTDKDGSKCRQWLVVMEKTQSLALGVDVATYEDALVIKGVREGLVQNHNKTHPREQQVQKGDVIVSVNGHSGNGESLFNCVAESGPTLKLVFKRVLEFRVIVTMAMKLGIGIALDEQKLMIMEINESGLIAQHNRDAKAGLQITPGDAIVEVNGIKGAALELQRIMTESGNELNLLFIRE